MKNLLKLPRSVLGGVLLGSALALSAAPHAEGVAVQYGDVDLSSTQGASVLYERISRAAKRVCAPPTRAGLRDLHLSEVCYQGAVSNAVNSVNANTLTALHLVKRQKALPG